MKDLDSTRIALFGDARKQAWLPFALMWLAVGIVAALAGIFAVGHLGLVADTMIVSLCLVPLVILLIPIFIGVVLGIWVLRSADKQTIEKTVALERAAANAKTQVQAQSRAVGQQVVSAAAAVERLEPIWRTFDQDTETKGQDDAAQPAGPQPDKPQQ